MPAVTEQRNEVPDPAPALDVETVGRLVQEQHVRVAEQRTRQVESSLLTAGELSDAGGPLVQQVQLVQHLVDRASPGGQARLQSQGLGDGEVPGEAARLQQDARTTAYCGPVTPRIQPQDADLALVGSGEAFEQLDGRGLARSVGAEEGGDGAGWYVEVDATDGAEGVLA